VFETKIGSVVLKNPVLTASGTFGMGEPFEDFYDYGILGGVVLKTLTPKPRKGNPPPRLYETPSGLLNSIGLENEGFDAFAERIKKNNSFVSWKTRVVISLAGDEEGDFAQLAAKASQLPGIDLIELNLSCPNVHAGGATFDAESEAVYRIVSLACEKSSLPCIVKLSPQHCCQCLSGREGGGFRCHHIQYLSGYGYRYSPKEICVCEKVCRSLRTSD